jgi:hypothetical protein
MAARKKKKKRDRKKRLRARKPGFPHLPPDSTVIANPPGEAKMSEVLLEFIEPYTDERSTTEDLKKVLSVATLAWNLALFPEAERPARLQEIEAAVPPDVRPTMRAFVEEMLQRKLTYFAHIRRAILDYQVSMTPDGPHVQVISTLPPK